MKYPQLVSMPSAVSDWLEEQLEARGIDAVVYTRYVLSLLHRDSLDLISSDQDIQTPKEARRTSGRGRKRFRRSAEWWNHVRADVEQLRRSAAVECLMSASDQKCGIESLVDELCEKLKDLEQQETKEPAENSSKVRAERRSESPLESARRYYAAFPPLSRVEAASAVVGSRKRHQRSRESAMKGRAHPKKPGGFLGRVKKQFASARAAEKNDGCGVGSGMSEEWELSLGSNRAGDEGYSTSDTAGVDDEPDDLLLTLNAAAIGPPGSGRRVPEMCDLCTEAAEQQLLESDIDEPLAKLVAKFDNIEALWREECDFDSGPGRSGGGGGGSGAAVAGGARGSSGDGGGGGGERDSDDYYPLDLPVDIRSLLASPSRHDGVDRMMNDGDGDGDQEGAASGTGTRFIQCGTNITSSIWSDRSDDDDLVSRSFYDGGPPWEQLVSFPVNGTRWSEADGAFCYRTPHQHSLLALNHNEDSRFREVQPGETAAAYAVAVATHAALSAVLPRRIPPERPTPSMPITIVQTVRAGPPPAKPGTVPPVAPPAPPAAAPDNHEDLLTSARTHFRPIKNEQPAQGTYADGTTFAIRGSLERVSFRRSDSGGLYLDGDEYKEYERASEAGDLVLKFCVRRDNEKCCQTEEEPPSAARDGERTLQASPQDVVPAKKRALDEDDFYFPGDEDLLRDDAAAQQPDNNNCWPAWQRRHRELHQIWTASEEACRACRRSDYTKLREELSRDGDQLLEDLSSATALPLLPASELSFDLGLDPLKERKRRHSSSLRHHHQLLHHRLSQQQQQQLQLIQRRDPPAALARASCFRFSPLRPVTL